MIDIELIKKDFETVEKLLNKRGEKFDLSMILQHYSAKNQLQVSLDDLKNKKNNISKEIGNLSREGKDATKLKKESEYLSEEINGVQGEYNEINEIFFNSIQQIPNLPDLDVPEGISDEANIEINRKIFKQEAGPDHVDIGEKLGLLDFKLANKLSGSRFVVLKPGLAKLQRALISFMLDYAEDQGFQEYYVPYIVNSESLFGTGQLPKFEDDQFKINEDQYLIPTAEVPLTNLYRDTFIDESDLPINISAHTPCFRKEAGSYGKDTRGMIRQHQFEKVEVVKLVHPSESENALDEIVQHATSILDKLELSYRTVILCTGDLGFSSAKTIDIEVWLPSQNNFREISSCSNFRDFQTRRMNARVKGTKGKYYPHSLNGSALAVGRTLLAIVENYYDKDKGIRVPEVLKPYLNLNYIK
ncbi:MAG: serine--tRNA ligase [SAR86 cluster bacterium]|uniref:Serine--tRNA ligase n=1 Tax=SAR86 cluster bacterium TaxID=2030880 RepID=A0A368BKN5_9GAMM|nr:MAG: serine--tRNA ligase [SAR86 cluster bacterium]